MQELGALGPKASPLDATHVIRKIAPVAGGYIETFDDVRHWETHLTRLAAPESLIDVLTSTRPKHAQNTAQAAVVAASVGSLVLDRSIDPQELSQLEAYRAFFRHGLGHPSALKLASVGDGDHRRTTYLSLIADAGAPPLTDSQVRAIEALAPLLRAALGRLSLPFFQRQPGLAQVAHDLRAGVVVLGSTGQVQEVNTRARELLGAHATTLGMRGRAALRDGLDAVLALPVEPTSGQRMMRTAPGARFVAVTEHRLDPRVYDLPEPMVLLLLIEHEADPVAMLDANAMGILSPREREVAKLLVTTGMSHAMVAEHLGVAVGTVRTLVYRIFQRLAVGSRAELAEKLRGGP
jgi:DNA-binding CsgD family transcriptional regulator